MQVTGNLTDSFTHHRETWNSKKETCQKRKICRDHKNLTHIMNLRSSNNQGTKAGSSIACKKGPRQQNVCHTEKDLLKKKGKLHTCDQCGKIFNFKSVLLKHQRIHSTERPFKCTLCGAAFKQYGCLLGHRKIHTLARSFVCPECGKCFNCKKNLQSHQLTHTLEKTHVCNQCGKRFALEERLKTHKKVHDKALYHKKEENVPFKCNICGQTFKYYKNLKVHERIHSADKCFSCRECWKVFSCERSLQKHLRQHAEGQKVLKGHVENTFSCTECKRTFQWESSLIIHQCSAQAERQFKCSTCGQTFKSESNLQAHGQVHTGAKWYSCEECGEGFNRKVTLRRHEMLHTGHTSYECSECGRLFHTNSSLIRHLKICSLTRIKDLERGAQLGRVFTKTSSENSLVGGDKPFKCKICGQYFSHEIKQLVHERFHSNDKDYSCTECAKCFTCKRGLWRHLDRHLDSHIGEKLPCHDCGKTFASTSSLSKHRRLHTGEMPYKCAECERPFRWRESFENHKRSHTGEMPYQCSQCDKKFATRSAFGFHRKIHAAVKAFKCPDCERTFVYNFQLKRHQVLHLGEKLFSCIECGRKYWFKQSLRTHMKTHCGKVKAFKCTDCEKTFLHNFQLTRHQVLHMGEKPFSCTECGKRYWFEQSLRTHLKTHSGEVVCRENLHQKIHVGETPFSCSVCSKKFMHKNSLFYHRKIHSGEKPFSCSVCSKSFIFKRSLLFHEKVHSGDRPFSCKECRKTFIQKSTLKCHMRLHNGVMAHQCEECGKSFKQKSELIRHQCIQTRKKPFPCTECEESFIWKKDLREHLKHHTAQTVFSCAECGKSFSLQRSLNQHQRVHLTKRLFSCSVCSKSFTKKSRLTRHEKIHSWDRPLSCSDCGKSFPKKLNLTLHQKVHSKEKSIKCTECGKTFCEITRFRRHQCHQNVKALDEANRSLRLDQTLGLKNSLAAHQSEHSGAINAASPLVLFTSAAATPKVAIPRLTRHPNVHTSKKGLDETKQMKLDQISSLVHPLAVFLKEHTGEMPIATMLTASTPNVSTHNVAIPRVAIFTDAISSAMKLVSVAKRTARKSYLSKLSAVTPTTDMLVMTSPEVAFSVFPIPNAVTSPTPSIPVIAPMSSTPVTESHHKETSSQTCGISAAERSFWCADCGISWKDKGMFSEHQSLWHMNKVPRLCLHCSETFTSEVEFEKHCGTHINNGLCVNVHAAPMSAATIARSAIMPLVTLLDDAALLDQKPDTTTFSAGTLVVPKSEVELPFEISNSTATPFAAIPAAVTCVTCGDRFHQITNLLGHLKTHVGNESDVPGNPCQENPSESFLSDDCRNCFKNESVFSEHQRLCHSTEMQRSWKFDFEKLCGTGIAERFCVDTEAVISPSVIVPAATTSTLAVQSVTGLADSTRIEDNPATAYAPVTMSPSGTVVLSSSHVKCSTFIVPTLSASIPAAYLVCYNPNVSGILPQDTSSQPCETSLTERAYWCVNCSMGFKYEAMLNKHQTIWHTPMKLKPCQKCGVTFSTRFENEMHRDAHIAESISVKTPFGIAPVVTTPAATKPAVPTFATTEIYHARPNMDNLDFHLCADSPTLIMPAANTPYMTTYKVTLASAVSATTTFSGTLPTANKDSVTEMAHIAKPADGHKQEVPTVTKSAVSMLTRTELNVTMPIVVKHADQLFEAMPSGNILSEKMYAAIEHAKTMQIGEKHAPSNPAEIMTSSIQRAATAASIMPSPRTNPDGSNLFASTSTSPIHVATGPPLKVFANHTFMEGKSAASRPAVTTGSTVTAGETLPTITKADVTPPEGTMLADEKHGSVEHVDMFIEGTHGASKPVTTISALSTFTATLSAMSNPASKNSVQEELGMNMLSHGTHAAVALTASTPSATPPVATTTIITRPTPREPSSLMMPTVVLPTEVLNEEMPAVTMSAATRPFVKQYDETLLIEGNNAACKSTLATPSTSTPLATAVTMSTSASTSSTVIRPDRLTSPVTSPPVRELDNTTLTEGKTTAGKCTITTSTATSPVAAVPFAVTPVTQCRNAIDQQAVLVLRWRIRPGMGTQLHE